MAPSGSWADSVQSASSATLEEVVAAARTATGVKVSALSSARTTARFNVLLLGSCGSRSDRHAQAMDARTACTAPAGRSWPTTCRLPATSLGCSSEGRARLESGFYAQDPKPLWSSHPRVLSPP